MLHLYLYKRVYYKVCYVKLCRFFLRLAGFILGNLPQERRDEVSKDHVCGGEFKSVEP